ncbi:hypothetical protein ABK040_010958 [Willaertia magna]
MSCASGFGYTYLKISQQINELFFDKLFNIIPDNWKLDNLGNKFKDDIKPSQMFHCTLIGKIPDHLKEKAIKSFEIFVKEKMTSCLQLKLLNLNLTPVPRILDKKVYCLSAQLIVINSNFSDIRSKCSEKLGGGEIIYDKDKVHISIVYIDEGYLSSLQNLLENNQEIKLLREEFEYKLIFEVNQVGIKFKDNSIEFSLN